MPHSTPNAPHVKNCTKCGETKSIDEYALTKYGKPNSWCRDCCRAAVRASYYKRREAYLRAQRDFREQNTEKIRAKWREYGRKKNYKSVESRARNAVNEAVRQGDLPPAWTMVCEDCQEAQAAHWHHHKGYGEESRLDVVALCLDCHGREHRNG